MTSPVKYSILPYPKGCFASGFLPASLDPIRVKTEVRASDALLIPSEMIWDESLLDYFNGADTKGLTIEQATNPNVRNFIYEISEVLGKDIRELTRQEQQDANEYWETIFTEVVNCNNRTLFVRFYEDDSKTLTLTFDN